MNGMKERVLKTYLEAHNDGLAAGTSGNVSEYDRKKKIMAITPTSIDCKDLTAEQIVIMRLDGEILEAGLKPSSEWQMHAEVYKAMSHVNAIIHTHSPRATSFALLHEAIPLVLVEMIPFFGGDIPLAEFGMPGTPEVGINAVNVMRNRNSCLLANHGVLVTGENLPQAYMRAIYVEDAATIYHYARQLGEPKLVPAEAADILRKKYNLV